MLWVFVAVHRLFSSCVWASHCSGFPRCRAHTVGRVGFGNYGTWAQKSWFYGSRAEAQYLIHGFSFSVACGTFPDQGSNSCLLHWQADSLPLSHKGSPCPIFKVNTRTLIWKERDPGNCSETFEHVQLNLYPPQIPIPLKLPGQHKQLPSPVRWGYLFVGGLLVQFSPVT